MLYQNPGFNDEAALLTNGIPNVGIPNKTEVAREYATALAELTLNSKPLINTLTIVAGENINAADELAKVIENRIHTVDPEKRLPVLYLLDSICKNIGGIYVQLFSQSIIALFCISYRDGSGGTRTALLHLLKTWNGLFVPEILQQIELQIQSIPTLPSPPSVSRQPPLSNVPQAPRSPSIHVNPKFVQVPNQNQTQGRFSSQTAPKSKFTQPQNQRDSRTGGPGVGAKFGPKKQQTSRVDEILESKMKTQRDLREPPRRKMNQSTNTRGGQRQSTGVNNIPASVTSYQSLEQQAQQLLNHIQQSKNQPSSANQGEVVAQLQHLQSLMTQISLLQSQSQFQQQQQQQGQANLEAQQQLLQLLQHQQLLQAMSAGQQVIAPVVPQTAFPLGNMAATQQAVLFQQLFAQQQPQTIIQPPVPIPIPVNNSFVSLPVLSSQPVVPVPSQPPATSRHSSQHAPHKDRPVTLYPAKAKFQSNSNKDPWSADALKTRNESVIDSLYSDFKLQCKNCGLRFSDRDKMDKHLDWHFIQNRKEKEKSKRAMSRNWFLGKDDWMTDTDNSETSATPFPFIIEQGKSEDEVKEKIGKTVAVAAIENQPNCPVCGERFDQFWDNEQEEWMYKDAVLIGSLIYHVNCSTVDNPNSNEISTEISTQEIKVAAVSMTAGTDDVHTPPAPTSTNLIENVDENAGVSTPTLPPYSLTDSQVPKAIDQSQLHSQSQENEPRTPPDVVVPPFVIPNVNVSGDDVPPPLEDDEETSLAGSKRSADQLEAEDSKRVRVS